MALVRYQGSEQALDAFSMIQSYSFAIHAYHNRSIRDSRPVCESQIIACNVPSAKKSSRTIVYTREKFSDSNVWLRESLYTF